jgi:hypothetical protein
VVDPDLDVTYGPHPVQAKSGTITVPSDLLREIGMEKGDKAHWALNPDIPGTLVFIPTKNLARITSEILQRLRELGG